MGLLTLRELGFGLGQADSVCGPAPDLELGEKSKCCPGVGWVIYDALESEIGLCRRAGGPGPSPAARPGEEEAAARREEFRAREAAREEKRLQHDLKMMYLQAQLQERRAVKARAAQAQAARAQAQAAIQAKGIAKIKAAAAAKKAEQARKVVAWGAIALAAAKAFALF